MKWNESCFRPLLCTYRLHWVRRNSWGWWDEWDDTALHTQDSKFKPWRSEAKHATSRSRRLPTILSFTSGWGRNITVSSAATGERAPNCSVKGSGANPYPKAPAHLPNIVNPEDKTLNQCWFNVKPTLIQRLVSAWNVLFCCLCCVVQRKLAQTANFSSKI